MKHVTDKTENSSLDERVFKHSALAGSHDKMQSSQDQTQVRSEKATRDLFYKMTKLNQSTDINVTHFVEKTAKLAVKRFLLAQR